MQTNSSKRINRRLTVVSISPVTVVDVNSPRPQMSEKRKLRLQRAIGYVAMTMMGTAYIVQKFMS